MQKQQGDVLFLKISSLPQGVERIAVEHGRMVLAHGEVTGHAHEVRVHDDVLPSVYRDPDGIFYMDTAVAVEVLHPEHGMQVLEPGIWEIGQVVEVDPFAEAVRRVQD